MALHLTDEFTEGYNAEINTKNPYDFFDEYEKSYAWDMGNQRRKRENK